jgi:hypothetical protein
MDASDQLAQQLLSKLINKDRDFKGALRYGKGYLQSSKALEEVSAHVWFQVALAARLSGADATPFQEGARKAPDYTPILEGDLLRDAALQNVRLGRIHEAELLVPRIYALHIGDENREAALSMVKGRIEEAKGKLWAAASEYGRANWTWMRIGERADPQWVANNLFAWFRVLIKARGSRRREIYDRFMAVEVSAERRKAATIMMRFGRPAAFGYDLLARIKS